MDRTAQSSSADASSKTVPPSQMCTGECDNPVCEEVLGRYRDLLSKLSAFAQDPHSHGVSVTVAAAAVPVVDSLPEPPIVVVDSSRTDAGRGANSANVEVRGVDETPQVERERPAYAQSDYNESTSSPTFSEPAAHQSVLAKRRRSTGGAIPLTKKRKVDSEDVLGSSTAEETDAVETPAAGSPASPPQKENDAKCHWATCTAEFRTSDELVPHISKLHLSANRIGHVYKRLQPHGQDESLTMVDTDTSEDERYATDHSYTPTTTSGAAGPSTQTVEPTAKAPAAARSSFYHACKWALCSLSSFFSVDELFQHLCSDHLDMKAGDLDAHGCLWRGCGQRFHTFDELTDHVSEEHIGSGQSEYICLWENCDRDRKPFTQRQKVMRHIQTHTGDKPYQCTVCNQRFSEAGIMTQHMRTHTGERPYKCPEPACLREFAIAGALTIHKRKHTGEKPFKCKADGCEKRFAESSNLTKHLRVHTGEKPFKCPEQECDRKFARPDQVARHRKTHEKPGASGGA
ncbi:uncharacterized protein EV422DRAFT_547890 [Fimicolochytrium jonesii]|uniref:uncharacterized protein n=1 Tax=Fimicolochytrium jonesii TaxID=1396493 RepID=UPI0022FDB8A3|nr:uncharacterized protein EV422DRAFT_547890 [Fimicolochytrium jonesii]KAI8815867.1 hypothetical protein EV422DRAFT_547890 [Fimicolochytrium jonesii]